MLDVTVVYYQRCLAEVGGAKYTFFKACNYGSSQVAGFEGRKCEPPTHTAFTLVCLQCQVITRKQKHRGGVEELRTGGPACL